MVPKDWVWSRAEAEQTWRRRRVRALLGRTAARAVLVGLAMGLIMWASACGGSSDAYIPLRITGAWIGVDGTEIQLWLKSCRSEIEVESIEETVDQVLILVRHIPEDQGDIALLCQDGVTVTLSSPLAGRTVIDVSTDTAIRVEVLE